MRETIYIAALFKERKFKVEPSYVKTYHKHSCLNFVFKKHHYYYLSSSGPRGLLRPGRNITTKSENESNLPLGFSNNNNNSDNNGQRAQTGTLKKSTSFYL